VGRGERAAHRIHTDCICHCSNRIFRDIGGNHMPAPDHAQTFSFLHERFWGEGKRYQRDGIRFLRTYGLCVPGKLLGSK
jgi:hypothetical protein